MVEVLKEQNELCRKEEKMRLSMAEKGKALLSMDTSPFTKLEGRVSQIVLRMSADRVFWNDDSYDFTKSFVRFVKIFSDEMATHLKTFALVD